MIGFAGLVDQVEGKITSREMTGDGVSKACRLVLNFINV